PPGLFAVGILFFRGIFLLGHVGGLFHDCCIRCPLRAIRRAGILHRGFFTGRGSGFHVVIGEHFLWFLRFFLFLAGLPRGFRHGVGLLRRTLLCVTRERRKGKSRGNRRHLHPFAFSHAFRPSGAAGRPVPY